VPGDEGRTEDVEHERPEQPRSVGACIAHARTTSRAAPATAGAPCVPDARAGRRRARSAGRRPDGRGPRARRAGSGSTPRRRARRRRRTVGPRSARRPTPPRARAAPRGPPGGRRGAARGRRSPGRAAAPRPPSAPPRAPLPAGGTRRGARGEQVERCRQSPSTEETATRSTRFPIDTSAERWPLEASRRSTEAAARTCISNDESGAVPTSSPARASSTTAASSRGASSSSFTISLRRLAVDFQCTARSDSPCWKSRTPCSRTPRPRESRKRRPLAAQGSRVGEEPLELVDPRMHRHAWPPSSSDSERCRPNGSSTTSRAGSSP
jgi:hypothetical protein